MMDGRNVLIAETQSKSECEYEDQDQLSFVTDATIGSPEYSACKKLRFEDEEEESNTIPPEISAAAEEVRGNLIPDKSSIRYNKTYDKFIGWLEEKKINWQRNPTLALCEGIFLAYFGELARNYAPNSLWATYSMLKSVLNTRHNLDIYKFKQLIAFLKKNGKNYDPKKSKLLTENQINEFIKSAPNNEFLATKVNIYIIKLHINK